MKFEGNSQFKVICAIFIHDNQHPRPNLIKNWYRRRQASLNSRSLLNLLLWYSKLWTRNSAGAIYHVNLAAGGQLCLVSVQSNHGLAQKLKIENHLYAYRLVNLSGQAIAAANDLMCRLYGPDYQRFANLRPNPRSAWSPRSYSAWQETRKPSVWRIAMIRNYTTYLTNFVVNVVSEAENNYYND